MNKDHACKKYFGNIQQILLKLNMADWRKVKQPMLILESMKYLLPSKRLTRSSPERMIIGEKEQDDCIGA